MMLNQQAEPGGKKPIRPTTTRLDSHEEGVARSERKDNTMKPSRCKKLPGPNCI